jgi:hypothetical protein
MHSPGDDFAREAELKDESGGSEPMAASPVTHSESYSGQTIEWADLVDRIKANEPSGMEDLYRLFSKGIRFYLCRQLGPQELDDKVHDTFLIVVQAIRRGDLREAERLMGFVRTVVRRQVAAHIEECVQRRRDHLDLELGSTIADGARDPEMHAILRENSELMEGCCADSRGAIARSSPGSTSMSRRRRRSASRCISRRHSSGC